MDHIRPRYVGGTNDPQNLQRLCPACNALKGTVEMDFRETRSARLAPHRFARLPEPLSASDRALLEQHLRQVVNLSYGAAAVQAVHIGQRGVGARHWTVTLHGGNDPAWVQGRLEELRVALNARRGARLLAVESIRAQVG